MEADELFVFYALAREWDDGLRENGQVAVGRPILQERSLAARACELGRIEALGQHAKASREVRIGDLLKVKNDGGEFQVEVLLLSEIRGPAVIAQTLYRETEASRESRLKLAEERGAMPHYEASREGKPSKRDRRKLDRLRSGV
jgi:ribosome-associated heat shock protein Hsp15